jgi:hypothetical protein
MVELRCGAVSLGRTYLLPPLSSGGALVVRPWLRFHIPLIEPDRRLSPASGSRTRSHAFAHDTSRPSAVKRTSPESAALSRRTPRAGIERRPFRSKLRPGRGSGTPPAKMSQRVSLSDGEGLLPSLCSDEPRAERTDQRVRQRSTHRVRDFVFARFAERPVFARPTETSCRIKQRTTY